MVRPPVGKRQTGARDPGDAQIRPFPWYHAGPCAVKKNRRPDPREIRRSGEAGKPGEKMEETETL